MFILILCVRQCKWWKLCSVPHGHAPECACVCDVILMEASLPSLWSTWRRKQKIKKHSRSSQCYPLDWWTHRLRSLSPGCPGASSAQWGRGSGGAPWQAPLLEPRQRASIRAVARRRWRWRGDEPPLGQHSSDRHQVPYYVETGGCKNHVHACPLKLPPLLITSSEKKKLFIYLWFDSTRHHINTVLMHTYLTLKRNRTLALKAVKT